MQQSSFTLITILVISFVLMALVSPLLAKLGIFDLPSFLNTKVDVQKPLDLEKPVEFDFGTTWETVVQNDVTGDGQPQTASHSACVISKLTYDDFTQNGDVLHGTDIPLSSLHLINWVGLKFDWNAEQQRPYVVSDLTPVQKEKLGNAGCNVACAPELDETCVTKYFSQMSIGGKPFCGEFTKFFSGRLQSLKFGNDKCSSIGDKIWGIDKRTNPFADEQCRDICPNENRVVDWEADSTKSIYDIDDSKLKEGSFPPSDGPLQPDYAAIIYWNDDKKAYKYVFTKVPKIGTDGPLSNADLAAQIINHIDNYKRTEPAGYTVPELTTTSISNYVLNKESDFSDFVDSLSKEATGEIITTECDAIGDCLTQAASSAIPYKRILFKSSVDNVKNQEWIYKISSDIDGLKSSDFLGEAKDFFKSTKIFTNIKDGESLDRQSIYFVIVKSWELKDTEKKNQRIGQGGNAQDFCINVNKKSVRYVPGGKACNSNEVGYGFYDTYSGFLDRSVIIYKQPLHGFDECGNSFPENDACGTKEQVLDLGKEYKNANVVLRFLTSSQGALTIEQSVDGNTWTKLKDEQVSPRKSIEDDDVENFEQIKIDLPFRYLRLKSDSIIKHSSAKIIDKYELGFDHCGNGLPINDGCTGSEHVLDLQQVYTNRDIEIVWRSESGLVDLDYSIDGESWNPKVSISFPAAGLHSERISIPDRFRFVRLKASNNLELKYSEAMIL